MRKGYNYKSPESEMREKAHQFGRAGGNRPCDKRIAVSQREFYRWCESKATKAELDAYIADETKPHTRREFVKALLKCHNVRDFFALTDQTHGKPKEQIDVNENPITLVIQKN